MSVCLCIVKDIPSSIEVCVYKVPQSAARRRSAPSFLSVGLRPATSCDSSHSTSQNLDPSTSGPYPTLPGCLATAGWKGSEGGEQGAIGNKQGVLKKLEEEEEEGDLGDVRGK